MVVVSREKDLDSIDPQKYYDKFHKLYESLHKAYIKNIKNKGLAFSSISATTVAYQGLSQQHPGVEIENNRNNKIKNKVEMIFVKLLSKIYELKVDASIFKLLGPVLKLYFELINSSENEYNNGETYDSFNQRVADINNVFRLSQSRLMPVSYNGFELHDYIYDFSTHTLTGKLYHKDQQTLHVKLVQENFNSKAVHYDATRRNADVFPGREIRLIGGDLFYMGHENDINRGYGTIPYGAIFMVNNAYEEGEDYDQDALDRHAEAHFRQLQKGTEQSGEELNQLLDVQEPTGPPGADGRPSAAESSAAQGPEVARPPSPTDGPQLLPTRIFNEDPTPGTAQQPPLAPPGRADAPADAGDAEADAPEDPAAAARAANAPGARPAGPSYDYRKPGSLVPTPLVLTPRAASRVRGSGAGEQGRVRGSGSQQPQEIPIQVFNSKGQSKKPMSQKQKSMLGYNASGEPGAMAVMNSHHINAKQGKARQGGKKKTINNKKNKLNKTKKL